MNTLIVNKAADWSVCNYGFNISIEMQDEVHKIIGHKVGKGENVEIKLIIEDQMYDAVLTNINFDRKKFNHSGDLLQIRYSPKSLIAAKMRDVFRSTYEYVAEERIKLNGARKMITIPEEKREYLQIYSSDSPFVFIVDYIQAAKKDVKLANVVTEEQFESDSDKWIDFNATIEERQRLVKIRKIDRKIGDNLKKFYEYRCQMTGERVGEKQGGYVVEAHHIEYFVTSHNNDASNIIILSPNYHRIVHKFNPKFDKKKLAYVFDNGLVEEVKLNKHL